MSMRRKMVPRVGIGEAIEVNGRLFRLVNFTEHRDKPPTIEFQSLILELEAPYYTTDDLKRGSRR